VTKKKESLGMAEPLPAAEFVNSLSLPRISKDIPPVQEDLVDRILKADEAIFGSGIENRACSRALLLLQAGDFEHSHRLVQEMAGKSAAYVHGMLHRVEGDYSNAKYWFSRAADHPAFLHQSVDPIDLTDQVEQHASSALPEEVVKSLLNEVNSLLTYLLKL
jgi:hypothetical protein